MTLLVKNFFCKIQSKPLLEQLETVSYCPVTCYLGQDINPHLATASFHAVVNERGSSEPPLCQAEQPQVPPVP